MSVLNELRQCSCFISISSVCKFKLPEFLKPVFKIGFCWKQILKSPIRSILPDSQKLLYSLKISNHFQESQRRPTEDDESTTPETETPVPSTSSSKSSLKRLKPDPFLTISQKPVLGYARFFDDDKYDVLALRDPKDIKVCDVIHHLHWVLVSFTFFIPLNRRWI